MENKSSVPDFIKMEEDILKFWDENEIFEKLKKQNENTGKHYRFLDGPITANNAMGVHHAWNRSLKDFMLRYKAMNGYSAHYQNGFDAHGLPVELEVEKELGLHDKRDIAKYGMEKFVQKCLDRVQRCAGIITEQSKRLGQWMDWDNSYFTNSDTNITSIWHFLKECHRRGWLVEKYKPRPWCAHCGTSLSEHETLDNYKDMEHMAVFFKAPVKDRDFSMVVWTTTPWTLSANVAVAINPEFDYAICNVKSDTRKLVVCDKLTKILKDDLISIDRIVKGSELVGLTYETCLSFLPVQDFEHKIVAWDEVDNAEGTGAVHIAPGCGESDFELGQRIGLDPICPIDENGIFYPNYDFLAGKSAMEVADIVFDKLKENNKLYYTHKYTHRYPICWRCKNPLVFRLTKEWYIKADEIRPALIECAKQVEWQPEFLEKRMIDWLNNMEDWSISRKRYYGLPLPFYRCPDCGELTVVGSLEELEKLSSKEEVENLPHLHRPYIDEVKITCPKCGAKVSRVTEVGDCWLDAGITPFSTKKYFSDKKFFDENFPADCVVEMKEQVRLWFYSLLFMSVTLVGTAPYKKVIGFASLVSEDGSKFSKSGKNNISFFDAANKIGSDVIRYMYASNNMLNDTRFGYNICDEMRRKIMSLNNACVFFNTYANLDKPDIANFNPKEDEFDITDKWLIEKTNNLIAVAKEAYEGNKYYLLTKEFETYVDDLSNWYIRTNRRRFWKSENEQDKLYAYWTLFYAIKTTCQVMAPIIPFITENIWQTIVKEYETNEKESIFLSSFPERMSKYKFEGYVEKTETARNIIAITQRLRNENQIKIKQPLKHLFVIADMDKMDAIKMFEGIIKDELNIKAITFEHDNTRFNDEYLTVNFKTAGMVLKGAVQQLKTSLLNLTQDEQKEIVEQYKHGKVSIGDFKDLSSDIFVLCHKPKQDYVIATESGLTCVLDITIDEDLMLEGVLRELIRSIQVLRKEKNLKIEQRIGLEVISTGEIISKVVSLFKDKIMQEVLAEKYVDNMNNAKIEERISVSDEDAIIKINF